MIHIKDEFLEEKNEIINYSKTHFYINILHNPIQYGVRVNVKEKEKLQDFIKEFKKERKEQIEAWNERQKNREYQNR